MSDPKTTFEVTNVRRARKPLPEVPYFEAITRLLGAPSRERVPRQGESGDDLRIGRNPGEPRERPSSGSPSTELDEVRLEGDCLYLTCRGVSRKHAVISRNAEGNYSISDSGSRNGTTLNGQPITTATLLNVGDHLLLSHAVSFTLCDADDNPELF